jgi:hypothetical protein
MAGSVYNFISYVSLNFIRRMNPYKINFNVLHERFYKMAEKFYVKPFDSRPPPPNIKWEVKSGFSKTRYMILKLYFSYVKYSSNNLCEMQSLFSVQ